MKKIFSIFCGVLMVLGLMVITPTSVFAVENAITLEAFLDDLKEDGVFDGQGNGYDYTTVKWEPDELNGTEIQRIQEPNAQYGIVINDLSDDIVIKNTRFEYVPKDIVGHTDGWNSNRTEWTATDVQNAEFQFKNYGSVTIENCSFEKVIISPYGDDTNRGSDNTRSFKVTNSTFSNVYNAYALKDIYPHNVTITGNKFVNCSGAIYFEGSGERGQITISNNVFDNIDTNAPDNKKNTRGIIQMDDGFDVKDALTVIFSGNTILTNTVRNDESSSNALPVIRLISTLGSVTLEGWTPGDPISILANAKGVQLPTISTVPQEYNGSTYTFLGWVSADNYTGATSEYDASVLLENGYNGTVNNNYYYGVWHVEPLPQTVPTQTPASEPSDTSCAANDKNCDGVVTCDEANGAGWVWSEDQKMCVLTVTPQSTSVTTPMYQMVNTSDR